MFDYDLENGTIRAYGEVGWPDEGFTEMDFMRAFDAFGGDDVRISINSPGGDVSPGLSILNQIQDYPGEVTVEIDAMAASIASVFPMAADKIVAHKTSRLMVHNPWTIVMGEAMDFRHTADVLDSLAEDIADTYSERTGRNQRFWLDQMAATTYYKAQEAKDVGLIDEILGEPVQNKQTVTKAPLNGPRPRLARAKAISAKLAAIRAILDTGERGR